MPLRALLLNVLTTVPVSTYLDQVGPHSASGGQHGFPREFVEYLHGDDQGHIVLGGDLIVFLFAIGIVIGAIRLRARKGICERSACERFSDYSYHLH